MKQKLTDIRERLTRASDDAGRDPATITLVAVTKTRSADQIRQAMDLGLTHFGENRMQEAADKWPTLKTEGITLHLIGPLQTNKVKQAMDIFDVLHTLDRPSLLQEMQKNKWAPPCFVQVNTGEEDQKSGILPQDLPAFMDALTFTPQGFMCIPPVNETASLHFAFLTALARQYRLTELSMGMSDDFEAAIKCGATHIRIGSALFQAD